MNLTGFEKIVKYLFIPMVLIGSVLLVLGAIHIRNLELGHTYFFPLEKSSVLMRLIMQYSFWGGACILVLSLTLAAWAACQEVVNLTPHNIISWNKLAFSFYERGDFVLATKALHKMLTLAEAHQDKKNQALALHNLGLVYRGIGRLNQAEDMYRNALVLEEALGHKEGIAKNYAGLGCVYRRRGNLDQAEEMYRKSLKISDASDLKEITAEKYETLGRQYKIRGNLDQTEKVWKKSLSLYQAIGHSDTKRVQWRLKRLAQHRAKQQAPPVVSPR